MGKAAQDRLRAFEGLGDLDSPPGELELAQGRVEVAVAQLQNGNEPVEARAQLDIAQQQHVVAERGHFGDRNTHHGADELRLLEGDERRHPERAQLARKGGEEGDDAVPAHREPLKAAHAVDDEALHLAAVDGIEEALGGRFEDLLDLRLVEDFDVPLLDEPVERNAEPRRLDEEALRRLEKAEEEARHGGARFGDEFEADRGLAAARRAEDEGDGADRQAAGHHGIEAVNAGRRDLGLAVIGHDRTGEARLGPRINGDARSVDAERVASAEGAAAAELANDELAHGAHPVELFGEIDEAVDHGMLGGHRQAARAGQKKHSTIAEPGQRLKLVDELLVFELARGAVLDRDEAIQHQDRRPARLHLAPDQRHETGQPFSLEDVEAADEVERPRHEFRPVEAHIAEMRDHAGVVFGQKADVERPSAAGHMAEGGLIAEDRLPGAGRALDDIDAAAQKAAVEDFVQSGNAA